MLFNKNKALSMGLIATAVFGITLASCSNDDDAKVLRRKEIPLRTFPVADGGKVIIQEKTDSTFELTVTVNKSTKDLVYKFNIVEGDTTELNKTTPVLNVAIDMGTVTSQTTGAAITKSFTVYKVKTGAGPDSAKLNYDALLTKSYFARVYYATGGTPADSTIARAKIGKN